MGECYNPFPKLPKNIRQMGERDETVKLYVEDYVNTYLRRLTPSEGGKLRTGLLLGSADAGGEVPFLFADGALEMENAASEEEQVVFTEAAWKKAYEEMEEMFPKRSILGWFICGAPGCMLSPLSFQKQHSRYFAAKNQLLYLNSGIDGEEAFYRISADGFSCLRGFSIYYERNQMMQDYMIHRKDAHRVESAGDDRVIRDFRTRMEGRKREAVSRSAEIRALGVLCSVLAVTVLASGAAFFGSYRRMKEMESVLASVLPEGFRRESEEPLSFPETQPVIAEEPETEMAEPELSKEPHILAEPEEQRDMPAPQPEGGNATAGKDFLFSPEQVPPVYVVGAGETLHGICYRFYNSLQPLEEMMELNGLEDADRILAGQELILPKVP